MTGSCREQLFQEERVLTDVTGPPLQYTGSLYVGGLGCGRGDDSWQLGRMGSCCWAILMVGEGVIMMTKRLMMRACVCGSPDFEMLLFVCSGVGLKDKLRHRSQTAYDCVFYIVHHVFCKMALCRSSK